MAAVVGSSCTNGSRRTERFQPIYSIWCPRAPLRKSADGKRVLTRPDRAEAAPSRHGDSPMSEERKQDRRRFLGTGATTVAAAQLGTLGWAQPAGAEPVSE